MDNNAGSPYNMYTDIESHNANVDDSTDNLITSNGNSHCDAADTEDNSFKPHIYAEVDVKKKKATKTVKMKFLRSL